jgi:hypothetical protein
MAQTLSLKVEVLQEPAKDDYFCEHYVMLKLTHKNNS